MSGFLSGGLLGTFSGTPESFFFDTIGLFFPVGENADLTRNQQAWNWGATGNFGGPGISFLSGRFTQSLSFDGEFIVDSGFRIDAGLTVETSRLTVARIPEPGTLALLGLGLLGLSITIRKRA